MNIFYWSLVPAVCAGISAAIFMVLILQIFQQITIEKKMALEVRRKLPIIFKLALPFVANVRFIARHSHLKGWREQTEQQLGMAGYSDTINAEDFISARIILGIYGAVLLVLCIAQQRTMFGFILLVIMVIYPAVWLRKVIQARHAENSQRFA